MDNYYPFGLTFNSYQAPNNQGNDFKYNGKEQIDELGLDLYDYEARFYDPSLGRFNQIDPLADDYHPISPYVYVANNPINFIDPDGRTIIGSDGKAVTYTRDDDDNVTWSDNATDDAKKLGNALLLTEEGTSALDKMINIETEITLKIDAGEGDGGGYAQTDAALDENGDPILNEDGTLQSATITVFEGALNKDKSEGSGRFSDASTDEFLNATGVHENEHLSPDQIQKDYNYTPRGYKDYITNQEGVPLTAEYNARKTYRGKYGGNSDWKSAYIRNGINPENLAKPKKKKKGN